MNKKGTHVGMILSFVIFITFIVFLYISIQPVVKTEKNKEVLLDFVKLELERDFSSHLTVVTVKGEDDNCLELNLEGSEIIDTEYLVKSKTGKILGASKSGDVLNMNNGAFKIYFSDQKLNNEDLENSNCAEAELGQIQTREYIFESKIKSVLSRNYQELKIKFGVPGNSDFGFIFINNSDESFVFNPKNVSSNVYVDSKSINYIDADANFKSGVLITKVW